MKAAALPRSPRSSSRGAISRLAGWPGSCSSAPCDLWGFAKRTASRYSRSQGKPAASRHSRPLHAMRLVIQQSKHVAATWTTSGPEVSNSQYVPASRTKSQSPAPLALLETCSTTMCAQSSCSMLTSAAPKTSATPAPFECAHTAQTSFHALKILQITNLKTIDYRQPKKINRHKFNNLRRLYDKKRVAKSSETCCQVKRSVFVGQVKRVARSSNAAL